MKGGKTMNLKEYEKIEEKYGAGSKEASEAYRDLMITDLKPISTETHIDEWGATIVTLNQFPLRRILMSGALP